MIVRNLNDINLLPTLKEHSQFESHEIWNFQKFKIYCFKISKFEEFFTTCKWCVIYMTYKKRCSLWYKKRNPKIIRIFWYDSKIWLFFKMKHKKWQICTIWKIPICTTMTNKKKGDILRQLYVFLITSCKIFIQKFPRMKKWKGLRKTRCLSYIIISLAT